MNTREAIAARILQLCRERGITPNGLSNISTLAQSQMDVAEMLNETAEPVSIRQKLQQLQGPQNRQSHDKERVPGCFSFPPATLGAP